MANDTSLSTGASSELKVRSSLSRLHFFFGQLLTQRDLDAEQRYHLLLQRLSQRETFGTGTVSGLDVRQELDGQTPLLSVFVMPGLAIDPDGRELILEAPACVQVATVPVAPANNSLASAHTKQALVDLLAARFGSPMDIPMLDALVDELTDCNLMTTTEHDAYESADNDAAIAAVRSLLQRIPTSTPSLHLPETLGDFLFDSLVAVTFIGLRYSENGAEPAPAVLDATCTNGANCFPSRTQEGVFIVTSATAFPDIADPFDTLKKCLAETGPPVSDDDLCRCLADAWRGLPPASDDCTTEFPVVPIARVCSTRFDQGDPSPILRVDNCTVRLLAPGGPALRALRAADGTPGGGGGSGYTTIQKQDNTLLPQHATLKIVGNGVTLADEPTRTVLTVETAGLTQEGTIRLAGDLKGPASAPQVQSLLGGALDPTVGAPSSDNMVLTWKTAGHRWIPTLLSTASTLAIQNQGTTLPPPAITTLNFTGPGVTVTGGGGTAVFNVPEADGTHQGTILIAGDLSGAGSAPVVKSLRGASLSTSVGAPPADNLVLTWKEADHNWAPAALPTPSTLAIQEEGATLTPTITTLNFTGPGVTVTTDGSGTAVFNVPKADGTHHGTLLIAGDLSGNGDAPTVVSLRGAALAPAVGAPGSARKALTWDGFSQWIPTTPLASPALFGDDTFVAYVSGDNLAYAPRVRIVDSGTALALGNATVAPSGTLRTGASFNLNGLDAGLTSVRSIVAWGGAQLDIGNADSLTAVRGSKVQVFAGPAATPMVSFDPTTGGSGGAVVMNTANTALVLDQPGQYIEMTPPGAAPAATTGSFRVGSSWSLRGVDSAAQRNIINWGGGLQVGDDGVTTRVRGATVEAQTSGVTRLAIDDTKTDFKANFVTGTTGIAVFAQPGAPNVWGGGVGVVFIANATHAPDIGSGGRPSGGGFLYAEGGYLKWKGPSGTVTVLGVG